MVKPEGLTFSAQGHAVVGLDTRKRAEISPCESRRLLTCAAVIRMAPEPHLGGPGAFA
jgi:hypothetical protein